MADMVRWEYHVEKFGNWKGVKPEEICELLNAMGMDGWEVVGIAYASDGSFWATAKRPLTSAAIRERKYLGH